MSFRSVSFVPSLIMVRLMSSWFSLSSEKSNGLLVGVFFVMFASAAFLIHSVMELLSVVSGWVVWGDWLNLSCCSWEHLWYLGFADLFFIICLECYSDVGNVSNVVWVDACEHVAGYVLDRAPPFAARNEINNIFLWSFLVQRALAHCFVEFVCD